ncbi:MAG: hypothetical protein BroJett021_06560 [Chloroflexota bacterium]|nr:hypothetical protein [Caldilinea sp.]GIK71668.1 MAG: hypothetical protein BroJett021_06560 [Chloroflexota bacterium]
MSSLSHQLSDLDAAWKLLQQRWQATGEVWNDRVYEEFAAQHMEPLAQQTQAVAASLERLAQVVSKAQRAVK